MGPGTLGKYTAVGALFGASFVLVAAVLARLLGRGDAFLDSMALAAFLFLIGQQQGILVGRQEGHTEAVAKINGLATEVRTANIRLDAINAPPAAASRPPEDPHA
jgi:hypothetical protein